MNNKLAELRKEVRNLRIAIAENLNSDLDYIDEDLGKRLEKQLEITLRAFKKLNRYVHTRSDMYLRAYA